MSTFSAIFNLRNLLYLIEAYKAACKANGTTPTTVIKKFIAAYIAEHQATEEKELVEPTKHLGECPRCLSYKLRSLKSNLSKIM